TVGRVVIHVYTSFGGQIYVNYDLLASRRLKIVGEIVHRVRHCLLALSVVLRENITRVISHPQALSQCHQALTNLGLQKAIKPATTPHERHSRGEQPLRHCYHSLLTCRRSLPSPYFDEGHQG
ncbi:Arogenate dehydratase 2, partial [Linum grandiflorum]